LSTNENSRNSHAGLSIFDKPLKNYIQPPFFWMSCCWRNSNHFLGLMGSVQTNTSLMLSKSATIRLPSAFEIRDSGLNSWFQSCNKLKMMIECYYCTLFLHKAPCELSKSLVIPTCIYNWKLHFHYKRSYSYCCLERHLLTKYLSLHIQLVAPESEGNTYSSWICDPTSVYPVKGNAYFSWISDPTSVYPVKEKLTPLGYLILPLYIQ
jgi:hypothetical protein